jgi:hypothetical protein
MICSYGLQDLCRRQSNRGLQRGKDYNLLWLERQLPHCWVVYVVSAPATGVGADVVADSAGVVGLVAAV